MAAISNETPLWQMTAGQFIEFLRQSNAPLCSTAPEEQQAPRRVYGLKGIQELFHCSNMTAQRLKKGVIAPAVHQYGRKIVTDADLALQLFKAAKEGRQE